MSETPDTTLDRLLEAFLKKYPSEWSGSHGYNCYRESLIEMRSELHRQRFDYTVPHMIEESDYEQE